MKVFTRTIIIVLMFFLFSQHSGQAQSRIKEGNKGKLYVLWGWNWGYYSASDIRFTGQDYDFVLKQVKAQDKQTPFSWGDYFSPTKITIPQTNFRIGYFISDNWNLSLGVDHMKYVMTNGQTVKIDGYINNSGTPFDGVYKNNYIVLSNDFLQFEHTDGLNYINAEISYVKDIFELMDNPKENLQIYLTGGVGAGLLLPKTNTRLLGKSRHDDFNVSGFGVALKGGINVTFFKHFFLQSELKGGYINMPNIATTPDTRDRASQHFFYLQPDILFGLVFKIANK
jgi:hypothetical protein